MRKAVILSLLLLFLIVGLQAEEWTYNKAVREAVADRLEREGKEADRKRFYDPNFASKAFGDQIGEQ